jgi:MFS family permease
MLITTIKQSLVLPIKSIKLRYIPLLMIYFAYGASTFSGIAESFFIKEKFNLSAQDLMLIAVWIGLPWTIKMVFGQFVDCIPFFKSTRKSYIFLAAFLMTVGSLLMVGLAGEWSWLLSWHHPNAILIAAALIISIGNVLQDVVADALSVEVVDRSDNDQARIKKDLSMVQLLGRLSLSIAMFAVAGLGGWLAHILSYQSIFLLTLIIPCISVSGCLFIKTETPQIKPINKTIFFGGMAFAGFVLLMAFLHFPGHQEVIIAVSIGVVILLLWHLVSDLDKKTIQALACAAFVIFIFRAMPSVGPGLQWWEIDVLHFSKAFFGTLAQIGTGLAILGMWFLAKWITEKPVGQVMLLLTVTGFILSLPIISLYHGLHLWTQEHFGFGAHTIALVDTALASPLSQLSMIPMLRLIAIHAPRGNAATWFALMASLMNLALSTGALVSKWLNHIWVVSREVKDATGHISVFANYSQLGHLLWFTTIVGLLLPSISIILFLRGDFRKVPSLAL